MPITLDCTCGRKLVIGDEHAGKQGRCPNCGGILDIPSADPPLSPEAFRSDDVAPLPPTPPIYIGLTGTESGQPGHAWPPPDEYRTEPKPRRRILHNAIGVIIIVGIVVLLIRYRQDVFGNRLGEKLAVSGAEEIYYKNVPVEEAQKLGNALKDFGYFDGKSRATVQLVREADRYVVSCVVKEGAWKNAAMADVMWLYGMKLSAQVFQGKAVDIRLCDQHMKEKKLLSWGDPKAGKWLAVSPKEDIFYRGITDEEARKVGEQLQQLKEFDGKNRRLLLISRDALGLRLAAAVDDGAWNDMDKVDAMRFLVLELAARVFDGQPIEMRLCGDAMAEKKRVDLSSESLGKWLAVSPREDLYYRDIGQDEARKLADMLQRQQFFDGQGERILLVARDAGGIKLTFFVMDHFWDNPDVIQYHQSLGQQIRREIFSNEPVEVRLADVRLRVKRTIAIP